MDHKLPNWEIPPFGGICWDCLRFLQVGDRKIRQNGF